MIKFENSDTSPYKIDILIITYNQQDYISQAIDGILSQEHEFSYRINIADDFSTDKTREIITQYKEKYPNIINLILSTRNLGGKKNFINGTKYLLGEYISCLDGDDYWCDNKKLQKQISFLEENPDFVGCAHNTLVIDGEGITKEIKFRKKIDDTYTIRDLLDGSISFPSSSLIFRNVFHGKIPDTQNNANAEDLFFSILHAQYGKIKYIDKVMSVYRSHGQGEWSSMQDEDKVKKTIQILTYAENLMEGKNKLYSKYGIKKSFKNLYKQATKNEKQNFIYRIINYVKFRILCYQIKIYELKKKYERV